MKPLIVYTCDQGTPEWFEARAKHNCPTASDFGSIITAARGEYAAGRIELICKLIDAEVRPDDQEEGWSGNKHTERGKEIEPEALSWYENFIATDACSRVGFIYNPDLDAGASPDLLVGLKGGVEAKAPDGKTHIKYLLEGKVPDEYKAQVHGNLAVSRRAWWDFISYCPGYRPLVVRTVRNEYTEKLELILQKFSAEKRELMAKVIAEN